MGQGSGDAQATSDPAVAQASVPECQDVVAVDRLRGTSDPLAEGLRPLETPEHPLTDQIPLELREHGEDAEHRPAGGGGRVDRLIQHDKVNAEGLELRAEGDQVLE